MKKIIKNDNDSIVSKRTSYTEDIEEFEEPTINQSLENTNDILFSQNNIFILNKKLVKQTKKPKNKKLHNNSFLFKPKLFSKDYDDVNMEKWFRNRIKITHDEKNPKKKLYKLYSDDKIKHSALLYAQKENGIYVIRNDFGIEAKIRWNIFSNHFKVYDDKDNLIEEIIYNFNFKGWNGPTKLKIFIPKTLNKKKSWSKNKNKQIIHKTENKVPEFSEYFKVFVLKFIRRKVIPNEKNIQIIFSDYKEEKDNILLQFAQSSKDEFILDYKYPFNNIIAFALGLTSLSSRTFCK
jgi:hypothetical protein